MDYFLENHKLQLTQYETDHLNRTISIKALNLELKKNLKNNSLGPNIFIEGFCQIPSIVSSRK